MRLPLIAPLFALNCLCAPLRTTRGVPVTGRPREVAPLVVAAGEPDCAPDAPEDCPPPTVTCPGATVVAAGRAVQLTATGTGAGPLRYRWTVPQAPSAEVYRFAPRYDRADSDSIVGSGASVPFTSVLVGSFVVHADVRDARGRVAGCDVPVTVQTHGLRVELSWNTENTDVDLHMLAGSARGWFTPADCYYASLQPDVALGAEALQRRLDRDDTDGLGPENIRIDEPRDATDYTVGVHYYSSHGQSGPTLATVVVYCGEDRIARMERPLEGNHDVYGNTFWTLGTVRLDASGQCTFQRVDTVTTAAAARDGAATRQVATD